MEHWAIARLGVQTGALDTFFSNYRQGWAASMKLKKPGRSRSLFWAPADQFRYITRPAFRFM